MLYLVKYSGRFTYFISHDIKDQFKNVVALAEIYLLLSQNQNTCQICAYLPMIASHCQSTDLWVHDLILEYRCAKYFPEGSVQMDKAE